MNSFGRPPWLRAAFVFTNNEAIPSRRSFTPSIIAYPKTKCGCGYAALCSFAAIPSRVLTFATLREILGDGCQIGLRVGIECLLATGAAEIILLASILRNVIGLTQLH